MSETTPKPQPLFEPEIEVQVRHALIALRYFQIMRDQMLGQQDWNTDVFQSIHTFILAPVFQWGGERRTTTLLSPSGIPYADPEDDTIEQALQTAIDITATTSWKHLNHADFTARAAEVYAHIHYAQPFTLHTGQVARIFLRKVAVLSNFNLLFARIERETWHDALEATLPTTPGDPVDPTPFIPVMQQIAVPVSSTNPSGYTPRKPDHYAAFDVVAPWLSLYEGTSLDFKFTINEVFANNWLDGWNPNRADVANLIDHHKGRLDTRNYLEEATIKIG